MKVNHIIGLMLIFLFIPIVLAACNKKIVESEGTIKVYFSDTAKGSLFSENVPIDLKATKNNQEQAQAVINAIDKGPQSTTVQANRDVHIEQVNLNKKLDLAYVIFDNRYSTLSSQEQMGIRSSLVFSLTELDFIKGVEFFIGDTPIVNINKEPIGPISRQDIQLDVLNPNPPTMTQTVALYFASADRKKLIKEEREIHVNNSVALEKYIIDELIKGSKQDELLPTIPKETVVNDVSTKEGVCQVDLSFDLKSKHFTTPESKLLMIYSIVNSLTELPQIQKIAFLIDGKKEVEFSKDIDLSEFFERKEALIE